MTPQFKIEVGVIVSSWIALFFAKLIPLIPQLQVMAILLAIISTGLTILLNIPKIIKLIKNLFRNFK